MATADLRIPISEEHIRALHVGDQVRLHGLMVTARDAAHKYIKDTFFHGPVPEAEQPVHNELRRLWAGGALYHCGPVVSRDDAGRWRFVSAGPTTSIREEPYEAEVIAYFGLRAVIGKGGMGPKTLAACQQHGAVYLHAVGGAATLIASYVIEVVAVFKKDELGVPEAFWVVRVEGFPAIVTMDAHGQSLHKQVHEVSNQKLAGLIQKLNATGLPVTLSSSQHQKECITDLSQLSEAALVEAAKAGQQEAFAEIVERYSGTIYNLALRLMNDLQEAEEVLQETFISAFRGLHRFEGRSKLSTWLYRIGYNSALMRLRKRRLPVLSLDEPREGEEGEYMPRQLADWTTAPDRLLMGQELRQVLDAALAALPESLRSVFVLRDIEGLSTAETAETLGLTEANAKVRLHRARLALRERLSGYLAQATGESRQPVLRAKGQGERYVLQTDAGGVV